MTTKPIFHDKQAKKIWYDLVYGKGSIRENNSNKISNAKAGELSNFHPLVDKSISDLSTLWLEKQGVPNYFSFTRIVFDYLEGNHIGLEEAEILLNDEKFDCHLLSSLISNDKLPIEILIEEKYYTVKHQELGAFDNKSITELRSWNLTYRVKEITSYLEKINPEVDLKGMPVNLIFGLINMKRYE